jgi:hypothetical protein
LDWRLAVVCFVGGDEEDVKSSDVRDDSLIPTPDKAASLLVVMAVASADLLCLQPIVWNCRCSCGDAERMVLYILVAVEHVVVVSPLSSLV